jgi:APA family basic amino acid/polyamine antiporter
MEQKASSGGRGLARRLGLTTAVLLVVADMVGSGVFTTSGVLLEELGSPFSVLAAWLAGGFLALCGALTYGELTAALPENGGEYHLLGRIYHPAVGFTAGVISLAVGFSAPVALTSLAFGDYLAALVPGIPPVGAAAALVVLLSLLHALHVGAGGGVQNLFAAAKVVLILAFIGAGLALGDPVRLATGARSTLEALPSPAFAVGLILVFFAYSGWNGAAYLAGEVRDPGRTLPRALGLGTAIVIVLYLGLNAVFFMAVPASVLAGEVEVGHLAAVHLFGAEAGAIFSGAIALALISAVSAMIMAGPRVYEAMGRDCPRLAFLRRRSRRRGPVVSIALQGALSLIMIATSSFGALLAYVGFTLSICAALTVLGAVKLRLSEPRLRRPYRIWAYPVTPILFVVLAVWMVVHSLVERPAAALAGGGTIALGLVLYLLLGRRSRAD